MGDKIKKNYTVVVDTQTCKACGYCKELCPKNVYEQGKDINTTGYMFMTASEQDKCIGCLTCVMVCPDFAITVEERG